MHELLLFFVRVYLLVACFLASDEQKSEPGKKKKRGVFVLEDFTAFLLRKPTYKESKVGISNLVVVFFYFLFSFCLWCQ